MKNILAKLLIILIIVFPFNVLASFFDQESISLILNISSLDFSLFSPHNNFIPEHKADNLKPGEKVTRQMQIRQQESTGFDYTIQFEKINGSDYLCQALELEAKFKGKIEYQGSLSDFIISNEMTEKQNIALWHFSLHLPLSQTTEEFCEFKFIIKANQSGFFDREEITSLIKTEETQEPEEPGCFKIIKTILFRSY